MNDPCVIRTPEVRECGCCGTEVNTRYRRRLLTTFSLVRDLLVCAFCDTHAGNYERQHRAVCPTRWLRLKRSTR